MCIFIHSYIYCIYNYVYKYTIHQAFTKSRPGDPGDPSDPSWRLRMCQRFPQDVQGAPLQQSILQLLQLHQDFSIDWDFSWKSRGIFMEYLWNIYGISMDNLWIW